MQYENMKDDWGDDTNILSIIDELKGSNNAR